MRIAHPNINHIIDTSINMVPTLIIENRSFFCELVEDIYNQINGLDGRVVLSDKDKILDITQNVDITTTFIPFELSRKNLVSKVISVLEKKSQRAEFFEKTTSMLFELERYVDDLSNDFSCDLEYSKLSVPSILKSLGVEIIDDSHSISEKMLNYMELVREFDRDKLFVTVNMRNFVCDNEMNLFLKTIIMHNYNLLMIESNYFPKCDLEYRYTIDEDLCEF